MRAEGQRLTLSVAEQLQELRSARGWSVELLAEAAGLHRTSVGLVLRGKRGLTIESAAALARALDVPLSQLIARAERQVSAGDASPG